MAHARTLRTRVGLSLAALTAAVLPAACTGAGGAEEEEEVELFQTKLEDLKDHPGHHSVTFSKTGAERADVKTTPVAAGDGYREIPDAALLYNGDGSTFVYTATGPRTYTYTPIKVLEVDDHTVHFTGGPGPGDPVVTSGVPQVHGADIQLEFGEIA